MNLESDQILSIIKTALEDKKAENIQVLDLEGRTSLAKYMVFASGKSTRNVASIAENVAYELKHQAEIIAPIEGLEIKDWVLIDAGDIIVHIFHPEARERFKLEEKWQ